MATAATDTIGSLVIDLRANVAQLQADMSQVKDIVTKSSAQMSAQMKSDFNETRQVLALMRDDFGVGIPRELRAMVASSETARTAILALSDAFIALAFVNIGVEAFKKVYDLISSTSEAAKKEAEETRNTAIAAMDAVAATIKRADALELIGKGEEARAALIDAAAKREIANAQIRLKSLQAELSTKLAIINLSLQEDIYDPGTGGPVGKTGQDAGDEAMRGTLLKQFNEETKDTHKQIADLQKLIEDGNKTVAQSDDQLAVSRRALNIDRIKDEETVALAVTELRRKTAEDSYAADQSSFDAYIFALKSTASKEQEIRLQGLYDTLAVLEQDPSRNVAKIQDIQAQIAVIVLQGQQKWTDILAKESAGRKKIIQDEAKANADAFKAMGDANKNSKLPSDLATSFLGNGAPKLNATLASFMQNQSQDFLGNTMKDAAAQGKILEQAMEALLTPTQKYQVLQAEIIPLMDKYKDYPDVVKALTAELQRANPEFQKLQEASSEFGKDLSTEIENIAISGKSLHDVFVSILQDLEKIVLEAELLKPLQNFFSGSGNSTGAGLPGFLSNLFGIGGGSGAAAAAGGDAGSSVANSIGGLFADGGNPPVGVPSIVGEEGPELFVPQSAGTIVPNGQYGGGTTYNISIDARGSSPGTAPAIQRAVQTALQQNVRQSVAASIDYQRRR